MIALAAAAVLWIAVHAGIAGTAMRRTLVARLGERGFLLAFSVASVGAIVLLITAWKAAPVIDLWFAPDWLRWAVVAAMLPAFVLFAGSMAPSPTAVAGTVAPGGPRGMQRVTRHPMLCSFAIWAGCHVLANGDAASLLFFGAFLVTAVVGMPSIDAKVAARAPTGWASYRAATSILPFAAIAAGRNRLVVGEMRWMVLAGVAAWAAMLWAHPLVIGVAAVPG